MEEGEKGKGVAEEKEEEFPMGFRFAPKDEELIKYYLLPRLQGRDTVPNDAIIEADVYEEHPGKLIEKYKDRGEEEWYFLSQRARKYQNGVRPSRSTKDGDGRWKASTGKAEAKERVGLDKIKFCDSVLAYFEGPIKLENKTKWLMHEFTIPQYEKPIDKNGFGDKELLDEYVMYKIYVTPRYKGNDDEAGPSGVSHGEDCSPAEECGQVTAGPVLSERQAGKRPATEQPRGAAPRPKTLRLGPPPPPYAGGARVPYMNQGYWNNGTARPMGYNSQMPPPRPPPPAHNFYAPMQPRHLMLNHGQRVLVRPQQPVLKLRPQYRRPGCTPNSFGQPATATMRRPPNPAGQPAMPAPAPQHLQKLNEPETEEMYRNRRVLQQYMEEIEQQRWAAAAFTHQQQHPHHIHFNQHPVPAPQFSRRNYYPYGNVQQHQQNCAVVPPVNDHGQPATPAAEASVSRVTNEGNPGEDCTNENSVELATAKMSPDGKVSADGDGPRHESSQSMAQRT